MRTPSPHLVSTSDEAAWSGQHELAHPHPCLAPGRALRCGRYHPRVWRRWQPRPTPRPGRARQHRSNRRPPLKHTSARCTLRSETANRTAACPTVIALRTDSSADSLWKFPLESSIVNLAATTAFWLMLSCRLCRFSEMESARTFADASTTSKRGSMFSARYTRGTDATRRQFRVPGSMGSSWPRVAMSRVNASNAPSLIGVKSLLTLDCT